MFLTQAFSLLGECVWDGGIVGMELYIRIASLALKQKDYELVGTQDHTNVQCVLYFTFIHHKVNVSSLYVRRCASVLRRFYRNRKGNHMMVASRRWPRESLSKTSCGVEWELSCRETR